MKHLTRKALSGMLASLALVATASAFAAPQAPECDGDKSETPKPAPKPAPKPPSAL